MPQASEVAAELRKLADSLDTTPDAEIPAPGLYFPCCYLDKQHFLNVAAILPRPFAKTYPAGGKEIEIQYKTAAISIYTRALRENVCRIVKPAQEAVYACEPLLSEVEAAQIGGAA